MSATVRAGSFCLSIAVVLVLAASEGRAQSLLQSLFGFGSPAPAPRAVMPPRHPSGSDTSYRTPIIPPGRQFEATPSPTEKSSTRFRTLCVRMCDGYYFPISASVGRDAFYRDANLCRSSCGAEARLFYHPASSGDASAMVDLTGRAYARLPNAFRYRKSMVDGCRCKPEPWAASEIDRHRRYAAAAIISASERQAQADARSLPAQVLAGGAYAAPAAIPAPPTAPSADPSSQQSTEAPTPDAGASVAPSSPSMAHAAAIAPAAPVARPSRTTTRNPGSAPAKASPKSAVAQVTAAARNRGKAPAQRVASARPPQAPPGLLGLGGPQLRWPGDR